MTPQAKRIWKRNIGARLKQEIIWCFGKRKDHLMAKHLEISQGTLSEIVNGISAPSAETLKKIALRTGIDIRWLLTGQKFK